MSTVEVEFNPFDPSFAEDPYPHWRMLRERAPVHRTAIGFWVLTRYDDDDDNLHATSGMTGSMC